MARLADLVLAIAVVGLWQAVVTSGNTETSHITLILQSRVTTKFVRPSIDGSFNARGRMCSKRTAFTKADYIRDGILLSTFRNLKSKRLLAAASMTTLTSVQDTGDEPHSASLWILHLGPVGGHLESYKYRGQFLAINEFGKAFLATRPMVDWYDDATTFLSSEYFQCASHKAHVKMFNDNANRIPVTRPKPQLVLPDVFALLVEAANQGIRPSEHKDVQRTHYTEQNFTASDFPALPSLVLQPADESNVRTEHETQLNSLIPTTLSPTTTQAKRPTETIPAEIRRILEAALAQRATSSEDEDNASASQEDEEDAQVSQDFTEPVTPVISGGFPA